MSYNQAMLFFDNFRFLIQQNLVFLSPVIIILWLIQLFNWALSYRLNIMGIYPRTPQGLVGIVFSPFLHGSFNHVFFNSMILFVLANFVLLGGRTAFYQVSITIFLLGGFAVWLFARKAIHIGASGIVMGYLGYLLANSYYHTSSLTLILAFACIYFFGSLLAGLFPSSEGVSWEGHVFGFLAGILSIYIYY